jgi:monoamine oxidase
MAYDAMIALGLLAGPASAARFELRGQVSGVRVLVLGAGLTGLTVAYELGKLGYQCEVLEARARPGGRVHTIRRGTASEEDGPPQVAAFDEGLYFNCGAMRIPHHHRTTFEYCRELQVPLEVFCITCDASFYYQQKAKSPRARRTRLREARADLDGYVAELLSKALSEDALDQIFNDEDRQRLLEYLHDAGALNEYSQYRGTPRRGYDVEPGPGEAAGKLTNPLSLSELLDSRVGLYLHPEYFYQNTMFQVVGGMDRLPAALAARLHNRITYRAAVREIRHTNDGVAIVYADARGGRHRVEAEYCVCTLPLSVLADIPSDMSPELRAAVAAVTYMPAGKIGLQFKRRFWEEDEGIFGGITRTDQEITEIVYPSTGFNERKGILVGYYVRGNNAKSIGERTPAERVAVALEQGGRIHPDYQREFETAFSVAWQRIPWNRGGWAQFSLDARLNAYPVLLRPDRRLYLAGDHLTNLNAWMNGAFESARHVATAIHARVNQEGRKSAA